MRKRIAWAFALLAIITATAFLGGPPLADAIEAPCAKPQLFLNIHKGQILDKVDLYLERNLAGEKPVYKAKNLAETDWEVLSLVSDSPSKVVLMVVVGENWSFFGPLRAEVYKLTVRRDCVGDEWRVTGFVKQKGEAPGTA